MENTTLGNDLDIIDQFFRSSYSPEFSDLAMDAIDVLIELNYPDVISTLSAEIYNVENEDSEKIGEEVCDRLSECMLDALGQQGVVVQTDSFALIAEILAATLKCQKPEMPELYETVLNSDLANEEILATILEDFCRFNDVNILPCLESVSDNTIAALRKHYTTLKLQKTEAVIDEAIIQLRKNLAAFFDYIHQLKHKLNPEGIIAFAMSEAGIREGEVAAIYYGYVSKELTQIVNIQNSDLIAVQLLSYFYYAIDTFKNPVDIYNRVGERLGIPPHKAIEIQAAMIQVINEFEQFKKAKNDTGRIPDIQHSN